MHSVDSFVPVDPAYDRLVHLAPTRSRESNQILDLLRSGRSVIVACLTGDGALDFGRSLAVALGRPGQTLLRVGAHTSAEEVAEFVGASRLGGGPRIMSGAHLLTDDTASVVDQALHVSRVPIAYLVDGDFLRAVHQGGNSVLKQIALSWSAGEIDRIDLAPLTGSETMALVAGLSATAPLDDLQLRTLAALCGGRPLVAADLVAWAEEDPDRVPRHYPHASFGAPFFGTRVLSRLAPLYPRMRETTLIAARRLGDLSPMPTRTAKQLFGDAVVSRLIDLRLAREFEVSGQLSVAVSPLHIDAMGNQFIGEADSTDEEQFNRRLAVLWKAGYPVGDAAEIALARQVIGEGREIDRSDVSLLLKAARTLNRLGDPTEASIMLHMVEGPTGNDAPMRLEWKLQTITARLLSGDRTGAVELVRTGLEHCPPGFEREPVWFELLFTSAATLAGEPELPRWWKDHLRNALDPVIPGIANLVTSFAGSGMTRVEDARAVVDSPLSPHSLRFAAYAALCQYHLKTDNAEALAAAAKEGYEYHVELTGASPTSLTGFTYTMAWYFMVGATVNCLLAGIEPQRSELITRKLLEAASGASTHSGWQLNATASWCIGIQRLLDGETDLAARDYEAVAATVTPALLAVGWGLRDTLGRWQRSNAPYYRPRSGDGSIPTQGYRFHDGLAAFLLGPGASNPGPTPAWMHTVFAHARVLDGTITAVEAVQSLPDESADLNLPGPRAARRHLEASAAEDAEALLAAGLELRSVGYRGAARHAFAEARALFLSQRLSSRARVAGEGLGALRQRAVTPPEDPQPREDTAISDAAAPSVTLTERELEVCRLVAEGLTNVQISQRLVLSVRTVESHVLQARAKLGAERRRDIPTQMLKLRDTGRINAAGRARA
ncbi:helix-turn-helix transcriptional regulator [Brevibacterium sp. JSBI002]|uniref:helix-turn-helix transcriptional regulator n=1 Tax=Brevibacterium sp. JSBI002 TaxID=2886045 RepID=UPI002230AB35|nr:LuxR family transcriptional regulator [Brevibacterium sp. JSBI002]UZD62173.1 LuxR C-terminal-related transcriptional regulator [Brevibacterium sp. JSBI002]